jgi:hypothetical protein
LACRKSLTLAHVDSGWNYIDGGQFASLRVHE